MNIYIYYIYIYFFFDSFYLGMIDYAIDSIYAYSQSACVNDSLMSIELTVHANVSRVAQALQE